MQPNLHNLSWEVTFLKEPVFFTAGRTQALQYAESILKEKDFRFASAPDFSVTHLLLGVPSFEPDGSLKGGGQLDDILPLLPLNVTVCGGMLKKGLPARYKTIDLLEDPLYIAENASITAHCALGLLMQKLPVTLYHCPVLVIGWGRIGKCLAQLLNNVGALVTVAARKEQDRAMLAALGYDAIDTQSLGNGLSRFRAIINTAPVIVLPQEELHDCPKDCVKIELASCLGIDAPDVIWARGLPNKDTPESSGQLIAKTILRLL